ncbi:major facilitator superfamily domain-containing protein [Exophiala viscosa]|uniref:Major facilitator superfamily domain-containing protein n=1 Tax=Exophiala viscosa TaxID=2486360 RepID=A0AAN6DMT8_9EURO|nr:major facilitator superfamily domain-containing protein [Exophiala viscosa]
MPSINPMLKLASPKPPTSTSLQTAVKGTREITYAFIGGVSISQITFVAPLVTYFSGRYGTRPTLAVGIVLETAGLIGASFATKVWHLFLAQGLAFGWGSSFLYVGAIPIVPQWLDKRRSFAAAIAAAGSGIGGMCYSLGVQAMIEDIDQSWAFRIIAMITFVMNAGCTLLMRDRNKQIDPNQKAFDLSLFKHYEFILVVCWALFSTMGYTLVFFSLPDNALKIGLTFKQGAIAGALANLGMAIGRPTVGLLSDRIGRINMVGIATLLCSIYSLCIWTSAHSYATLIVFALLGGSVCGTYYATVAPVLVEVLGIKHLPAAIVWTIIVFPTMFAEPIALELRQGGYEAYLPVQLFTGFMWLGRAICCLLLRAWAVVRLEEGALGKDSDIKVTQMTFRESCLKQARAAVIIAKV